MPVRQIAVIALFLGVLCLVDRTATAAGQEGTLELSICEASSLKAIPARVRVRDSSGKDHIPAGIAAVPIAHDRWFPACGPVRIEVPAGQVSIRVERGLEYRPFKETLAVAAGRVTRREIALDRWVNMRALGYVSGENHIHVPADELAGMLTAEDLDFGTSLSWWNGPRLETPEDCGWQMALRSGDNEIPTSLFDAEVEHAWGAVYLIGLRQPLSIPSDARRSNVPFVKAARSQGALICYQAGWSREVLVDALLGYVDVVNVCNNNFQRHRFQPRKRYSNLLDVPGLPEYSNTAEGMMRMNCETYYRLLNCGLRLAAGAGSAIGAKRTPAGYNRAYVRAGKNPTLSEFLHAWRQGRNFVTNGPMVFLHTGSGLLPGDTIDLPDRGGTVTFHLRAVSDQPLRSLELVVNGSVRGRARPGPKQREAELTVSVPIQEGSWVAALCTDEDTLLSDEELDRYEEPGQLPAEPTRLRYAHTSPIYVSVGGEGPRVPASVEEAQRTLDAFVRFARDSAGQEYRREILDVVPSDLENSCP